VSIEFLITSLVIVATPGTGVILTLAAGLSRGSRAAVIAAIGCTLGIIPLMAAAIVGLAAVLHASAVAFQTIKILGVVYLLYMAWQTLRDGGSFSIESEPDARSTLQVIWSAILANVLNPKLSIFFLAFLPQFVPAGDPNALALMTGLSAMFMLLTLVIFVVYGLLAAALRGQIASRPRVLTWLRRAFAGAFVALGARLALADR
jgi:threonine/homoserine/homoserine lactone efflux protein